MKIFQMKTAIQLDITFNQILSLVMQLPVKEKLIISKELEKEGIKSKLSALLDTFKTDELSLETINEEVEIVRQQIYDEGKY
jgi:hypothetical protein